MVLNENTPVVGKTLFWRDNKFSVFLKGEQKVSKAAYGRTDVFSTYVSNFRTLTLVVMNDTSLSTND